ncbi:helix-turn-helix domain-containing protein [Streptomyces sp. NBC_00582]|uniref:helix-turn-helix domain-containing protein n=1 Tax=Streptomyces sp. NBC_00582 TaxID=2975783 RepID=UPI002E80248A|nr:helix-turn-helix transcriptional regulator [Streptomyces sp. NBC_00582]WUB64316.1 helix-turn-helix transcriptional regulator [Streptomyces sp. NBC_00582]
MTGRTQKWKDLPSERSAELKAFVLALRQVKDSTGLTQQRIAKAADVAPTTLSGYLNGRRLPEDQHLAQIFAVIADDIRRRGGHEPHSLSELRKLKEQAARTCASCPLHARRELKAEASPTSNAASPRSAVKRKPPASRVVRSSGRRKIRIHGGHRRPISVSPSRTAVPVPLQEGDRHRTQVANDALTAELSTLRRHQAAGRTRDTHMLLWNKARSIKPGEFPETLAVYRAAGLEEEVETLLRTAAAERDVRAVLNIVAALHDSHQYADAQAILEAARTDA